MAGMSLQFIVMLSIMALWALTSLLSREAQPLPARPVRGPGAGGPLSGFPMTPGGSASPARTGATTDRRPASSLDRAASGRWNEASSTNRPGPPRGLNADDGLVIIEPDPRTARPAANAVISASAAAKGRTAAARRGSRGRSSANAGASKSTEPGRTRALTSLVTQSMAQMRNRPLEITPLSSPLSPINSPLTTISTGAKIEHPGSLDSPPAFTGESLRLMLGDAAKLREAALLTELLQPPLALRRPRRSR
jgi:hypothetical protein